MKVSNSLRLKLEFIGPILGSCSFASFSWMLFYYHDLDPFNASYPYFTTRILSQCNVRISLVHHKEESSIIQAKQRSYISFKRIDLSKLILD
jgi:hypothetical protein